MVDVFSFGECAQNVPTRAQKQKGEDAAIDFVEGFQSEHASARPHGDESSECDRCDDGMMEESVAVFGCQKDGEDNQTQRPRHECGGAHVIDHSGDDQDEAKQNSEQNREAIGEEVAHAKGVVGFR